MKRLGRTRSIEIFDFESEAGDERVKTFFITQILSFDSPSIFFSTPNSPAFTRQNISTTGIFKVPINISGSNFVTTDFSQQSRFGSTSDEGTRWISDTSVRAHAGQPLCPSRRLSVTSGLVVGTMTESLSFDAPMVSRIRSPSNIPTAATSVTLNGIGFGMYSISLQGRFSYTASDATFWDSSTTVSCKVSFSDRCKPHRLIVTVGRQSGSLIDVVTTDLALLNGLSVGNSPDT